MCDTTKLIGKNSHPWSFKVCLPIGAVEDVEGWGSRRVKLVSKFEVFRNFRKRQKKLDLSGDLSQNYLIVTHTSAFV